MKQSLNQFAVRAIIEFVVSATVFSIVGLMLYDKMDELLIMSLRESVAQQSQSVAYTLGERFQHKLDELQTRADLLHEHKVSLDSAMDIATFGTKEGRLKGILRQDGVLVAGSPLPEAFLPSLQKAFAGEQTIDYLQHIGMMFAVPMELDGEPCVFYEMFNDEAIVTFYKAISYNGRGTLILATTYDNWIMLSEGLYPELATGEYPKPGYMGLDISKITNFDETWAEIEHSKLQPGKTNTYYAENEVDAFFFHCTFISEKDNLVLSGYVEWDDVVVGIDYIYTMMQIMYGIVLVLLFFSARYTMKTRQAQYLEHEKVVADSANQAKSHFLANMSHEIRTPINAIMGMDEMILRESKEPATLEYAHNLQHAAKSLLGIINDVLDLSKIEAGKMEIIPVEYHLSSLLNDLVHIIQKRAKDKGLVFNIEASTEVPNTLFGDEIRLRQIVTNLLTNAVKYTEKGSVTLKVDYVTIDDENIYLSIKVSDTGIGIKKEDLKKLFCPFERIEEKRNRTIEGTGLGMNISEHLLAMMGTRLDVESVYGQGSTFGFRVAQRVMNHEPIGDFEKAYKDSLRQEKAKNALFTAPDAMILVVDDTVMNLTVVRGLLKRTKIQIDTATSGKECLGMVEKKKYDMIFLDHMMPGMDGIETLKAINKLPHNLNRDTPIISLTANAIRGAREQYIAAGFKDYLTKPIICAKLENLILQYLPPGKIVSETAHEEAENEPITLPEWLIKAKGLNVAAGVAHCGSESAYLDVLGVFADTIAVNSQEIESYFAAEDWKNYTTKVHALKSTAKIIGAEELSARAKRLEGAGNSGYINEIKEDHRPLMELYLTYLDKLRPMIRVEEENADKPPISDEELAEAFATMKDIVVSFDDDSLLFVLDSLDKYRLPQEAAAQCKRLRAAVAKPDWVEVGGILWGTDKGA